MFLSVFRRKRLRSNEGRWNPACSMRRGRSLFLAESFNAASRPHLSAAAADEILV